MKVGIGLPMKTLVPSALLSYARRVEDGPFDSLSLGERLTYECHDLMIALTWVAARTERIELMTSVLCLPMHNEGVVAKQAATLDVLSSGRFSLGVGLGGRPHDYDVSPAIWKGRAARFERQIATMRRIWNGDAPYEGTQPVGPTPFTSGGPELIIGAFAPVGLQRAGRLADGIRSFGFTPDLQDHLDRYSVVSDSWNAAGRGGRPKLICSMNFALGPDANDAYENHIRTYYGYDPELVARATTGNPPTSPEVITEILSRYANAGVDHVVFTALTSDITGVSLDHLAEVVTTWKSRQAPGDDPILKVPVATSAFVDTGIEFAAELPGRS